jgi:hypothetical protein
VRLQAAFGEHPTARLMAKWASPAAFGNKQLACFPLQKLISE